MRPITGPDLCRLLEAGGWLVKRVSGSHHIFGKAGERKVISVPVHGNTPLKPGLAARIARDANLKW